MLFLGQCPEHSPVRRMVFDLGSQAHHSVHCLPSPYMLVEASPLLGHPGTLAYLHGLALFPFNG